MSPKALALKALFVLPLLASPLFAQAPLTTALVANGFAQPVYATAPPGDQARIFVVEQAGRIRIVKNGTVLAVSFLDITGPVLSGGERGLLGLAFHPNYASNGFFYVNYTRDPDGATVLARYQVSAANPDLANPASASPSGSPSATTTPAASSSGPTASSTSRWATGGAGTTRRGTGRT
jgi:glucose/arabinose dehydrogenase